jgi:hypothetical protein
MASGAQDQLESREPAPLLMHQLRIRRPERTGTRRQHRRGRHGRVQVRGPSQRPAGPNSPSLQDDPSGPRTFTRKSGKVIELKRVANRNFPYLMDNLLGFPTYDACGRGGRHGHIN